MRAAAATGTTKLGLFGRQISIFILLLILGEAALWIFLPMGNEGIGNQRTITQSLRGLKEEVRYKTIGHRLRSQSMQSVEKPKGSLRLLCIGASTTDQPTQNVEDTWCATLERELRATDETAYANFHSVSYGRGGGESRRHRQVAQTKGGHNQAGPRHNASWS